MTVQPPKRTRICGPQSKNGCFTCRQRRIKCDEEKPTCLRCSRSNLKCDGYPGKVSGGKVNRPPNQKDQQLSLALRCAPFDGCHPKSKQDDLARLGCHVLSHGTIGQLRFATIDVLLPQLGHAIPAVNAAAATLGALLIGDELAAATYYGAAIRRLYQDLSQRSCGPVPTLIACALLALSEVLRGPHEENALLHLQGAYKLLDEYRMVRTPTLSITSSGEVVGSEDEESEDEITTLFRTMDLQTCSYALDRPSVMAPKRIPRSFPPTMDFGSARMYIISLTHSCYDFASRAAKYRYCPASAGPQLLIEQGRHIGALSSWLAKFNSDVIPAFSRTVPRGTSTYPTALVLRMTCLSILVYLSVILNPYETGYDVHAPHFEQIVADGRKVSALQSENESTTPLLPGGQLSLGPGIIQPLFFTAIKFRSHSQRLNAIALLKAAGRQGPWHGPLEGKVAQRLVEIEEAWPKDAESTEVGWDIPERGRVHGCSAGRRVNSAIVCFSRCRDVDEMISATLESSAEEDAPNVMEDRSLGLIHENFTTQQKVDGVEKWWDLWDEVLEY